MMQCSQRWPISDSRGNRSQLLGQHRARTRDAARRTFDVSAGKTYNLEWYEGNVSATGAGTTIRQRLSTNQRVILARHSLGASGSAETVLSERASIA